MRGAVAPVRRRYMLYYICPMHTFFTWGVFIPLYVFNQYNDSFKVLALKIACTLAVAVALYDVPGVFNAVMYPFRALLEFHDPLHKENAPMHEWFFRSGLDHLVWIFGMFCAFAFPWLDTQVRSPRSPRSPRAPRAPAGRPPHQSPRLAHMAICLFWMKTYYTWPASPTWPDMDEYILYMAPLAHMAPTYSQPRDLR